FIEGQALGARESHGFGDRLDDARAHDLVGCLGGLTRAYGPEVGDGAAERLQYRLRALERLGLAADHDGERAIARAFDSAAHRAVEEICAARSDQLLCLPRGS